MQRNNFASIQKTTPGNGLSGAASAFLLLFFFMPWFTACEADVSGMQLATQSTPGQTPPFWLLGIPLVALIGIGLGLFNLDKPPSQVSKRAWLMLAMAFYPLLSMVLLYVNFRISSSQSGLIDLRMLIQFRYGFWGTVLAALAMIGGAGWDIVAGLRYQPATANAVRRKPPPATPPIDPAPLSMPSPVKNSDLQMPPSLADAATGPAPQSQSASPQPAWLVGVNGAWQGRKQPIWRDGFTIGRHRDSDLYLTDKAVSRQHAIIRVGRGRYFIQDQGSVTGIYVNDRPVEACELKSRDILRIGQVEFEFQIGQMQRRNTRRRSL